MVRINDFHKRTSKDGREFFTLDITGEVEFVVSKTTGSVYATQFKGSITTTFDEATCRNLVGRMFPGNVERIQVEPYDYTTATGEVITLSHKYRYNPVEKQPSMEEVVFAPETVASVV